MDGPLAHRIVHALFRTRRLSFPQFDQPLSTGCEEILSMSSRCTNWDAHHADVPDADIAPPPVAYTRCSD